MTPPDPQLIVPVVRRPRLFLDEDMSERILDVLAGFGIDEMGADRAFTADACRPPVHGAIAPLRESSERLDRGPCPVLRRDDGPRGARPAR